MVVLDAASIGATTALIGSPYAQGAPSFKLIPKRYLGVHQWLSPIATKDLKEQIVSAKKWCLMNAIIQGNHISSDIRYTQFLTRTKKKFSKSVGRICQTHSILFYTCYQIHQFPLVILITNILRAQPERDLLFAASAFRLAAAIRLFMPKCVGNPEMIAKTLLISGCRVKSAPLHIRICVRQFKI